MIGSVNWALIVRLPGTSEVPNNAGIRLDGSDADVLVEELSILEPALVVLDSLTRFHTEDENHAGAMAALFHNAIKPLARETGAGVVLIHHANKTDSNSSYKRSRGSGDITASVDSGFDVREQGRTPLSWRRSSPDAKHKAMPFT